MLVEHGTHVGDVPTARLTDAAGLLTAVVPASCTGLTPYDSARFGHFLTAAAEVPPRWRTVVVRGCERAGVFVAAADWRLLGSVLFLNGIAVAPGARGQGLASALLDDGLHLARAHRCSAIELDVAADNAAALRLYERFGFDRVGESTWSELPVRDPGPADLEAHCRVRNWPAFACHHARYGFGDLEVTGSVGELTIRVLPGGWRLPCPSVCAVVPAALSGLLSPPERVFVVTDGDVPSGREQTRSLMSFYRMRLSIPGGRDV